MNIDDETVPALGHETTSKNAGTVLLQHAENKFILFNALSSYLTTPVGGSSVG